MHPPHNLTKNLITSIGRLYATKPKTGKVFASEKWVSGRLLNISRSRFYISTDVIKKHSQQIKKANENIENQYPLTFEQKAIVLNEPKMIQAIEIIEYGVKYKPGKKLLFFFMLAIGLFTYFQQQVLPQRIVDGYFAVSNQMNDGYRCGYILAAFTYEKSFLWCLPLMAVTFQVSKFIKTYQMAMLVLVNLITCGATAKLLVDQRVKEYEVWDQERIFYGEANLISIGTGFWTMLGFQKGFTGLKARMYLKSLPGAGIMRSGIPIGYVLAAYIVYFAYSKAANKSKNSQLVLVAVLNSVIWGLLMKRFTGFIPK